MAKKDTQKKIETVESKVIIAPRITEKASMQSSANAYTFVVAQSATKHTVSQEIKKTYKVSPVRVNITNLPGKAKFVRGKVGHTQATKKAVVFLKKGDTINLA